MGWITDDDQIPLTLKGTIRGKRNAVRATLNMFTAQAQVSAWAAVGRGETSPQRVLTQCLLSVSCPGSLQFASEMLERLFHEEQGKIVVYITSMQAIRKVYDDCRALLKVHDPLQCRVGPQLWDPNRLTLEWHPVDL